MKLEMTDQTKLTSHVALHLSALGSQRHESTTPPIKGQWMLIVEAPTGQWFGVDESGAVAHGDPSAVADDIRAGAPYDGMSPVHGHDANAVRAVCEVRDLLPLPDRLTVEFAPALKASPRLADASVFLANPNGICNGGFVAGVCFDGVAALRHHDAVFQIIAAANRIGDTVIVFDAADNLLSASALTIAA